MKDWYWTWSLTPRNLYSRRIHCPAKNDVTSVGFDFQGHFVTYNFRWMGGRRVFPTFALDCIPSIFVTHMRRSTTRRLCICSTVLDREVRTARHADQVVHAGKRRDTVESLDNITSSAMAKCASSHSWTSHFFDFERKDETHQQIRVSPFRESKPSNIC